MTMNFQVNLQGLIDLLSNHLYSDPGIFIRELLQNGVDAVTARKRLGQSFEGQVLVEVYPSETLSFTDNGSGLTAEEIEQFLARIGSTTKRGDLDLADDYIGQFGVGLLSCFVVSDEIVLITRSAKGDGALEWRGKPDGTYGIRSLEREVPVGTTVFLKAKPEFAEFFQYDQVEELLHKFGQYLSTPIILKEDRYERRINVSKAPWDMKKEEALAYVEETSYYRPMDIIPLVSAVGGVRGIAHVLPHAVSLQDEKRHRVYLKNMLLSDKLSSILPPWAFFVNGILNTDSLRPTASREAFQENELFFAAREELGECIKRYLMELVDREPELFQRLVRVHTESIKAMAVEDQDLYELFIRHLSFETSFGDLRVSDILASRKEILLAPTVDEFRQIARVAKSEEMLVVNGGYVHDLDLARRLPWVDSSATVRIVNTLEFAERFKELGAEEKAEVQPFLELSDRLLSGFQCQSLVRWFEPADLPVLYNTNQEVNFFRLADDAEEKADPLYAEVVRVIRDALYERPYARVCYNYNNPLVRKAVESGNPRMQKACIELFYTQALLLGNHPMNADELKLMNDSLLFFMNEGLARTEVDR
ncbi:HSP90 family protein [Gorillibacterium sp. CAU 1737]|uniref:HSP90 family protein n=1 Tax=Gorillibacterium sp. CAU 1737 TaxID=3140362 RepID=UPI00326166E1